MIHIVFNMQRKLMDLWLLMISLETLSRSKREHKIEAKRENGLMSIQSAIPSIMMNLCQILTLSFSISLILMSTNITLLMIFDSSLSHKASPLSL